MSSSNPLMDLSRLRISKDLIKQLRNFCPRFEDHDVLQLLATAFKQCRCTLVLGAGVSKSVELPTWYQLLDALTESICRELDDPTLAVSLKEIIKIASPLAMARYLETIMITRSTLASHLRKCLYATYDETKESDLLLPITQVLSSLRISHVLTYNFDNSLERCLTKQKVSYFPVHNVETYASKHAGLRIYHPHGLLPHPEDDAESDFLDATQVFSERGYNSLYMDVHDWANTLQLHHFGTRCCLFIGLSMTDPSMRRLLDFTKTQRGKDSTDHVTIQRVGPDMLLNALLEREMRSLGIKVLWIEDFGRQSEVLRLVQSTAPGTL